MKIAIVIPTYNRIEKLKRCLLSIESQTYQNYKVHVYCDNNDTKTYEWLKNDYMKMYDSIGFYTTTAHLNSKQEFVIGSWNDFFYQMNHAYLGEFDAVLWCVDDVELYPNALAEAIACMIKNFPDFDGVVGLKQECPGRKDYTFKWFGQVLIGRKFIERYKDVNYQACCPDYKHFYQDEEMYEYADSLNKFVNCETAILKHYHPAFLPKELDSTHPLVRGIIKRIDDATYTERIQKGLIWGESWTLVR